MKVETSRFGTIEIGEEELIHLPQGMIGFPRERRFVLLRHEPDSPFFWFQSADNAGLAFLLTDPFRFKPDYNLEIPEEDGKLLELDQIEEALQIMVVVNIHQGRGQPELTANLLGPVVVNATKRRGKQVILSGSSYSHRHPLAI